MPRLNMTCDYIEKVVDIVEKEARKNPQDEELQKILESLTNHRCKH